MQATSRPYLDIVVLFAFSAVGTWAGENNHLIRSIHWPSDGDKVTKTHYEYVEIPPDTLIWDFSKAVETGDSHTMQWSNLGDSTLVKRENGSQFTYTTKGDSIIWNAYENPTVELRNSFPLIFSDEIALQRRCLMPYSFNGTYCKNNYMSCVGVLTLEMSAHGTLILPNDTIADAIRVTQRTSGRLRVAEDKSPFADGTANLDLPLNHVVVIDRWYSPIFRYELAENISDRYFYNNELVSESITTCLCQPAEQEYSLDIPRDASKTRRSRQSAPPRYRYQNEIRSLDGNINELKNNISTRYCSDGIEISVDTKAFSFTDKGEQIAINGGLCDQLGRVWISFSVNCTTGDIWLNKIKTTELPQGQYILYFSIGESFVTKKIVIK